MLFGSHWYQECGVKSSMNELFKSVARWFRQVHKNDSATLDSPSQIKTAFHGDEKTIDCLPQQSVKRSTMQKKHPKFSQNLKSKPFKPIKI